MNLSEPLEGLVSAVDAGVLRVLARADAGFSGRQLHTLAGVGSTSSVHRSLTGLVTIGLVAAEARPPAIIYRANREHVLWPVVELALGARTRAFEAIREFCVENVPQEVPEELQVSVVVYGSVARRESTLDSDLDLFVVFPDDFDDDARADLSYGIAEHAERVTGNETQVYSVERKELNKRVADEDPLVMNVLSDGILIYGRSLGPTTRRLA